MPAETKATKPEVERRVLMVHQLLTEGASYAEIALFCSEKWEVGERQAQVYIHRAHMKLKETLQKDWKVRAELLRSKANNVYKKSMKDGLYDTAIRAIEIEDKLGGYSFRLQKELECDPSTEESTNPKIYLPAENIEDSTEG